MIGNMKKWSWAEMTSNINGKTSASGTMGAISLGVGLLGFLFTLVMAAFFGTTAEFVYLSIMVITIGAGMLGYRKSFSKDFVSIADSFSKEKESNEDSKTK